MITPTDTDLSIIKVYVYIRMIIHIRLSQVQEYLCLHQRLFWDLRSPYMVCIYIRSFVINYTEKLAQFLRYSDK